MRSLLLWKKKSSRLKKDIAANSSDYGALQELTEKKEQLEQSCRKDGTLGLFE